MESVLQAFALFQMSDVNLFSGTKKPAIKAGFFCSCIPRQTTT